MAVLMVGRLLADYPLIKSTNKSQDPLYSQQQQDIEIWYSGAEAPPPLLLFRYAPQESESLFSAAAAFNLPYETLATLNGWNAPALFTSADEIIVSNLPGIFLPESPGTKWERDMSDARKEKEGIPLIISLEDGTEKSLIFHIGAKFTSDERIRFLGSIFSSPLHRGILTSGFGYRASPFTGQTSFHPGIDIQVEIGTPVLAARDGKVSEIGTLEIYGRYVMINHDGNYQTMYAHLQEVLVTKGQDVQAGERVALSGNSGISTGPHLHFEIRRDGRPIDPSRITALRE